MKRLIFVAVLVLSPTFLTASPIYYCKDASGKATFQQIPCSADPMDSLADTKLNEMFKWQETVRKEKERLRVVEIEQQQKIIQKNREQELEIQAEQRKIIQENREKELERQVAVEAIIETERRKNEEMHLVYLKECMTGDSEFCEISLIANCIKDMRMGVLESVLGTGREQRVDYEELYYYRVKIKSEVYTLQVKYEVNRTKTGEVGQVGKVVSEVNYY